MYTEAGNPKLKILYLMKILLEKTDPEHAITMQEILTSLSAYGIDAERKSIYKDIDNLREYGMDIVGQKVDRTYRYYVASRDFALAELKLLVDSVQAAKFITAGKSTELIKKIEGLASRHEASKLHRQVYVAERIKTPNESVFHNVDLIHQAIAANVQIRFQYFSWNTRKQQVLRHDGAFYQVSPWALSWDDENYYMVAFDSGSDKIKHFRVDKMLELSLTEDRREGSKCFEQFDMAVYAKKMFGMFDGEEEMVSIECADYLAGVFIDRFGKNVMMIPLGADRFRVNVRVACSRQFLHWIFALGPDAKITAPAHVVEMAAAETERLYEQYCTKTF